MMESLESSHGNLKDYVRCDLLLVWVPKAHTDLIRLSGEGMGGAYSDLLREGDNLNAPPPIPSPGKPD